MSAFYNVDQPPFNMGSTARAIAAANNGLLFDIGDMSTMFQDAAGTIPVTAVEQPVGKILDKSGNGNHATQSVTASRPTLSARYNLLTKTEDFSDAVWDKTTSTITPNIALSPFGNSTACLLTYSSPGSRITQQIRATSSTLTFGVYLKQNTVDNGSRLTFYNNTTKTNLGSNTIPSLNSGGVDCGNGWRFYQLTMSSGISVGDLITAYIYTDWSSGAVVGSSLYVFGPSVASNTTIIKYQRVNTATDYDTNPAFFPKYLKFDGIDDYLNLPYMGLYANGSASVVAGVQLQPRATTQYIIGETTSIAANSRYGPLVILTTPPLLTTLIRSDSNAEFINSTNISDALQPLPSVTSVVDTGNSVSMRTKGMLVSTANYSRASTLTANTTAIGAIAQSTAMFFAKMNLYGLIITKSALTDAQCVRCERFLAQKSGVML